MFEYKTELLDSRTKWGFNDSADEKDVAKLDELLNQRSSEGWELVTYSYMTNAFGVKSTFAVTFRRKNNINLFRSNAPFLMLFSSYNCKPSFFVLL